MTTTPKTLSQLLGIDDVEYLLRRKFPESKVPPPINSGRLASESWACNESAREAYRAELIAMPDEDRKALVRQERDREEQAARVRTEAEEQARPFNQPAAMAADYGYWSKCAHWTLDEALALSFGRSPKAVMWESVKRYESCSAFAQEYAARRDLAKRAVQWEQLFDPVLPGIFLAWAKRMEVDVPPELIANVEARGVVVADWKTLFDKSEAARQSLSEALDAMTKDRDSLRERVAQLETGASTAAELKELTTRQADEIATLSSQLAANWPWGDRETKLLRHLANAADRLWKHYDPKDPTTAPTNKQVKEWLHNRGVPDRAAEIMAQILRPDGLPVGRRG